MENDPIRYFTGDIRDSLLQQSEYRCSNPFCDSPFLSLEAHHILSHARGGLTEEPNGLILCSNCHKLIHDGLIPKYLVYRYKKRELATIEIVQGVSNTTSEDLIDNIKKIKNNTYVSSNKKFEEINNCLVYANYLLSRPARFLVYINALMAKISILNDGVNPIRSNTNNMLISMNYRRKWAQILAKIGIWYAKQINEKWAMVYFLHSRAVGYNARNDYKKAVTAFRNALEFINQTTFPKKNEGLEIGNNLLLEKARLLRELAVCRGKLSQNSRIAMKEVSESLDIARSIGDNQSIYDAMNRYIEECIYEGEIEKAEKGISRIYQESDLSNHSRAITMKLISKLLIIQNKKKQAEILINEGLSFSLENKFNQQIYHFTRLKNNLIVSDINKREIIIT